MKVYVFSAYDKEKDRLVAIDISSTEQKARDVRDYWELHEAEKVYQTDIIEIEVDKYWGNHCTKLHKVLK